MATPDYQDPPPDCGLCPRLAAFRADNRAAFPDWFNAPVPAFGGLTARILVVGLAPGLRGANRTGRPFTGDYAGDLLYATMSDLGLASGTYGASAEDGFTLTTARVTNAVRCVPPENKPLPAEQRACSKYLRDELAAMPDLRRLLALGRIAHDAVLDALGARRAAHPFGHGAVHRLPSGHLLGDSYHCSRYNTNTGRLTPAMFRDAFTALLAAE